MNKIEVKILNPEAVADSEKMMVCAARLTQRGEKIKNMNDFTVLYEKGYKKETVVNMVNLPHPTIQKFGAINAVVVGASRRFLAQITRHQNEVKFISASLQYSDYSDNSDFVVPYEIFERGEIDIDRYLEVCADLMKVYKSAVKTGIDNDAAGYMSPQSLRNILIISATPYQWKHMIGQRICRRNTAETRYVMLRIWEQLYELNPVLFSANTTGPFCTRGICRENGMACGNVIQKESAPYDIIVNDFPLLTKGIKKE